MSSPEASLPLPVVPAGTPIAWSRQEIQGLAHSDADTAYRRTMLFSVGYKSLNAALYAADVMLEDIAGHCDTRVPWHQWRLAERPINPDFAPSEDKLLPPGYELVAEVEIIRGIQPLQAKELELIRDGLRSYRDSNPPAEWLGDPEGSFNRGFRPRNHAAGVWLLDIEPRILSREVPPSQW